MKIDNGWETTEVVENQQQGFEDSRIMIEVTDQDGCAGIDLDKSGVKMLIKELKKQYKRMKQV